MRAKRCEGDPLPRRPLSGYALQRPADPHGARNQQVRENNDASIPLHTLQGLRASARIKGPGGASDFFFFFGREKKSQPSLPLFLQKKCAKGARCAVPCLPPLFRSASYTPPPLYRLPLSAPVTAPPPEALHVQPPSGGRAFVFVRTRAALGRRASRRIRAAPRRMPSAPCTAPTGLALETVLSPLEIHPDPLACPPRFQKKGDTRPSSPSAPVAGDMRLPPSTRRRLTAGCRPRSCGARAATPARRGAA